VREHERSGSSAGPSRSPARCAGGVGDPLRAART
jgi:hypothetical protein